jgi:DNA-3-methyladenine glycosylase II
MLFDPQEATRALSKADPKLGALIRRWGPCDLGTQGGRNPYESLARSIVYQQLHGKAAATILGRFKAIYDPKRPRVPKPQELIDTPTERLRAAGLSGAKSAALKDLAAKALEGIVPTQRAIHRMSDAEILERLTQIRGIGPWTVEMLLIFQLGRLDVLPITDYGVRSGFALTYGLSELPTPKELLVYGERWKPYRSVAAWYLWRATDLAKEELAAAKLTPVVPAAKGGAVKAKGKARLAATLVPAANAGKGAREMKAASSANGKAKDKAKTQRKTLKLAKSAVVNRKGGKRN